MITRINEMIENYNGIKIYYELMPIWELIPIEVHLNTYKDILSDLEELKKLVEVKK